MSTKLKKLEKEYLGIENFISINFFKYANDIDELFSVKYLIKQYCQTVTDLDMYKNLFVLSDITEAGYLDIIIKSDNYIKIRLFIINSLDQLLLIGFTYWNNDGVFSYSVINNEIEPLLSILLSDCNIDSNLLKKMKLEIYSIYSLASSDSSCNCGSCEYNELSD